ncbi:MAG: HEPN domain-containing protein [Prevotellaceae bacterium]|jgi:HEPN domain-containing protein|nr:HEPN domain-containing protein [Prevotellaceae bacterium]
MIIEKEFDKNSVSAYWIESSDNDYKTTLDLFNTGNYTWSLFMGHLVVEKLLKAYYVKTLNEYPPMLHDLRRIGEKAGIIFDNNKVIIMETISQFNIRARYDDYKRNFSKICTREYAEKWLEQINSIRLWIKTMLSE